MNPDIIYEYEAILLDKKVGFSVFFFNHSPEQNEKIALGLMKHVIEKYLRWTPEQTKSQLNWSVIKRMKLDSIMKYIIFPPETDSANDLFVIAAKIYPGKIKIDMKNMTLLVYKRVLGGNIYKFPKGFFMDNKGINRALICMQYMLEQYSNFNSVQEMYKFFASSQGTKMLKNYKLNAASIAMFEYPIDFLHHALPADTKDEYWYRYYRFKLSNNEQIREMKKAGTFIN